MCSLKITFPLLLELLDKLLNDPSVQFLFDKNRYNLLQSTKVGLKLQPPQVTKDNVDVVEIECDDQLENCHDGIGIITRTQSMSSSAESNYETSSTIINQDQHEQFGRDNEDTILKDNDENGNLYILVQHENETVNTAITIEEDENSLVQDSVVKTEIGPIDEDCISINEEHRTLPFLSLPSPLASSTSETMPSLRPVRVRYTPVRYQPENFDTTRVTQTHDDDDEKESDQTDVSDDDYNVKVDLVDEKKSQAVAKIKSPAVVRYKSGISRCLLCDKKFPGRSRLTIRKHYQDSHGNPSVWPCNFKNCCSEFSNQAGLFQHRAIVHKNLPLDPIRIQTNSNNITKLQPNKNKNKLNGKRQLKDIAKPIFCLLCNVPFYSHGAIRQHYTAAHPNTTTSTTWQCFICPKLLNSRISLYHHRAQHHFPELEQLLGEKTSRREIRTKGFTCVVCKEKCKDVKKHYKEKHGKISV